MTKLISMASSFGELVDCRVLHLDLEFFQLSKNQLASFAESCYSSICDLLKDEFYTQWVWNSRKTSKSRIEKNLATGRKYYSFGCEADVISDVVFDSKSFRMYEKHYRNADLKYSSAWQISFDYKDIVCPKLNAALTPEQCKQITQEIFSLKGMKKLAQWEGHDVFSMFSCTQHENTDNLYYGDFVFYIAYSCLISNPTFFAEQLVTIVKQIGNQFKNVSGRVMLTPFSGISPYSPHMRTFYSDVIQDGSHVQAGVKPHEWYQHYYSQGAEWFNLISPVQLKHIPNVVEDARKYPEIGTEHCKEGGVIVRLKKPIDQIDIDDLVPIKKVMYNALYPGKTKILLRSFCDPSKFGYMAKPRVAWENMPIFDDEIIINYDSLVFQHKIQDGGTG